MPIKYNNFDIGNAYLGNDNLVAMYQGSNLVWTNGIKLQLKTHKTVDLGDFTYGNAGYTDNVVRVVATVGLENRQEMGGATLSPNNKINYVDYGLGVSDSESGNLSTKTYSYFVYIVLSKSAIGWTNSDGDGALSDRARDYLRGIKLTYEFARKNIIKNTKYAFLRFDGTEEWVKLDNAFACSTTLSFVDFGQDYKSPHNIFSNRYYPVGSAKMWENNEDGITTGHSTYFGTQYILVKDSTFNGDANAFKQSLSKNNLFIIAELSQPDGNTLDTLTAQQVYDLITLNGTDFSDLELLASGYEIKLGSFKSQETNTVDLGDLEWTYQSDALRFVSYDKPSDFKSFVSLNGFELVESWNDTQDKIIWLPSNNLIYIKDTRYTNATDFKNAMKGVKLTYELANKNNIAGSKYGFARLGDLSINKSNGNFTFYGIDTDSSDTWSPNPPNIYLEGFTAQCGYNVFVEKWENSVGLANDTNLGIYKKEWENKTTQEVYDLVKDLYFIYPLKNSLGNKLDNYTAEQVYYMFFSTLGMSKMYVPQGVRFESSDNIILGTKYGIRDFNLNDDWSYYAGYDGANCHTIQGLKLMPSQELSNVYFDGFKQIQDWRFNENRQEDDYVFAINIYGNAKIRVRGLTTSQQYNDFLKGKYLIYELASPNGTNYNDLSAKEMYDVINDNAIDILANGKSVNGVRSICGNGIIETPQNIGTYDNENALYISKNGSGLYAYAECDDLNMQIIKDHTYFVYIEFVDELPNVVKNNGNYNCLFFGDSVGGHIFNEDTYYLYQEKNYVVGVIKATLNGGIASNLLYYSNGGALRNYEMIAKKFAVVDLTANNIPFVANHDKYEKMKAYQYFKEHNLFKMTTTGEINVGGLKPKPKNVALTFTIDNVHYAFEQGMTWEEWCLSSYNTADLTYDSDIVYKSDFSKSLFNSDLSSKISKDATIIPGGVYRLD